MKENEKKLLESFWQDVFHLGYFTTLGLYARAHPPAGGPKTKERRLNDVAFFKFPTVPEGFLSGSTFPLRPLDQYLIKVSVMPFPVLARNSCVRLGIS